jgi:hypothetical protein
MNGNISDIVPIFGMGFVAWFLYLSYKEKQLFESNPSGLNAVPNSRINL